MLNVSERNNEVNHSFVFEDQGISLGVIRWKKCDDISFSVVDLNTGSSAAMIISKHDIPMVLETLSRLMDE